MKKTIILLTSISILSMISCLDSKKTDNENLSNSTESVATVDRKEKIQTTKFYMKNRTITDENGITYDLKIEKNEIGRKKMYESEKIFSGTGNEHYVIVSSFQIEYDFRLTSNGQLTNVIQYGGYELKSKRVGQGYGYCEKDIIFFPELNNLDEKKEVVSKFSNAQCNFGEEANNKLKIERNSAIKASGILDEYKIPLKIKAKDDNSTNLVNGDKLNNQVENKNDTLTITVDNLRVRTSPELESEKIENLAIGSQVEFLDKSNNQTTVTIKDNEITEYWYKVKTPSGKIGWIHGCCFDK